MIATMRRFPDSASALTFDATRHERDTAIRDAAAHVRTSRSRACDDENAARFALRSE